MFVGKVDAQQSAKEIEMMAVNGKLGTIGSEKGKEILLTLKGKNQNCTKKRAKNLLKAADKLIKTANKNGLAGIEAKKLHHEIYRSSQYTSCWKTIIDLKIDKVRVHSENF